LMGNGHRCPRPLVHHLLAHGDGHFARGGTIIKTREQMDVEINEREHKYFQVGRFVGLLSKSGKLGEDFDSSYES
jgi:hypothetical protein